MSSVEGKSDEMDEPGIRTYQLGLAWGVPGTGIVAVDLVKHAPGKAEEGRGLQTTYNYSAGFEAGIGGLVFRGGMFSNASLYPAPVSGQANQPTAIDYSGLSWGVALAQKSREVAVTYVRQTGSGTAQLVADSYETQKVQGSLESLLLSSRVFF